MRADARHGILDHDFVDPHASWTVPARVIANGGGAEFMITFFQPPSFTDNFFDEQIKLVDIELATLKELLDEASWELAEPTLTNEPLRSHGRGRNSGSTAMGAEPSGRSSPKTERQLWIKRDWQAGVHCA